MDLRSIVSDSLGSYAQPMKSIGGLVPTEEEDNWPANSGGQGGGHGHVSGTDWGNMHPTPHPAPIRLPPSIEPNLMHRLRADHGQSPPKNPVEVVHP